MDTQSASFGAYVKARANRQDEFFIRPAGGVDLCNATVPVRKKPA
jgi:peptidylprolyl isomerase